MGAMAAVTRIAAVVVPADAAAAFSFEAAANCISRNVYSSITRQATEPRIHLCLMEGTVTAAVTAVCI